MTLPHLSVIIPSRNAARWLPRAIASIGADPGIEILVVDDGSTDGTAALLARLARHDMRLRVLPGPRRGPAAARNAAIAAASAPLIAFLDADDRWRLDKLVEQLALHDAHPDLGFSFTDYRHVTEAGTDRGPCFAFWPRFSARHAGRTAPFLLGEDAMAQLFAENVVGTSCVIARTNLLRAVGGFDESLHQGEDWDLWLRLADLAPVGCVPRLLTDYTMHRAGNLSNDMAARLAGLRQVADRHLACVRHMDAGAARACAARLMVAAAEAEDSAGRPLRAGWLRLGALARQPSKRLAREAAAGVWGALRAA